jgi:hypothetical protein
MVPTAKRSYSLGSSGGLTYFRAGLRILVRDERIRSDFAIN